MQHEPEGESDDESSEGSSGTDTDLQEAIEAFTVHWKAKSEAIEAFAAHWKAKNKLADKKKNRGFVPPASQSSKLNLKDAYSPPDKTHSKCADCLQEGHWMGDAACPKVKTGITPAYVPKDKDRKKKKHPRQHTWCIR